MSDSTVVVQTGTSDVTAVTYANEASMVVRAFPETTAVTFAGAAGPKGASGVGVPGGGSSTMVLSKVTGSDYDTEWTPHRIEHTNSYLVTWPGGDTLDHPSIGVGYSFTYWVPAALDGFQITELVMLLTDASTSGEPSIRIDKNTVNIMTVPVTVDVGEKTSRTAVTPGIIGPSNTVATGDRLDIVLVATGTDAKGLTAEIKFILP